MSSPRLIAIMGVSGAGKSTLGKLTAKRLGAEFVEGDAFHSPSNKTKMRNGVPLSDEDRWPWLEAVVAAGLKAAEKHGIAVVACSALKRRYRDVMRRAAGEDIFFVHLDMDRETLERRVRVRMHEYMPASLLASQLATLEALAEDELGGTVDVSTDLQTCLAAVLRTFQNTISATEGAPAGLPMAD